MTVTIPREEYDKMLADIKALREAIELAVCYDGIIDEVDDALEQTSHITRISHDT